MLTVPTTPRTRFLLLGIALILAACNGSGDAQNSPQGVTRQFLKAIETNDGNLYLDSLDPAIRDQPGYGAAVLVLQSLAGSLGVRGETSKVAFRDLNLYESEHGADISVVQVNGTVRNLALFTERPLDSKVFTKKIKGKWYVSSNEATTRQTTAGTAPPASPGAQIAARTVAVDYLERLLDGGWLVTGGGECCTVVKFAMLRGLIFGFSEEQRQPTDVQLIGKSDGTVFAAWSVKNKNTLTITVAGKPESYQVEVGNNVAFLKQGSRTVTLTRSGVDEMPTVKTPVYLDGAVLPGTWLRAGYTDNPYLAGRCCVKKLTFTTDGKVTIVYDSKPEEVAAAYQVLAHDKLKLVIGQSAQTWEYIVTFGPPIVYNKWRRQMMWFATPAESKSQVGFVPASTSE